MGLAGDFEGTSRNVGWYKPKIYKRRTVQTSDQYNRRTCTTFGLVQMSDSTNVIPVHTPDQDKRRTKEKDLFEFLDFFIKKLFFFCRMY